MSKSPRTELPMDVQRQRGSALASWLLPAFLAMVLAGSVGLRSESVMVGGNQMSVDRAVFASVNAATLTGFQLNISANEYLPPGQYIILLLTIGGTLFCLVSGGLAVVRILKLPYTDGQVVRAALAWELIVLAIGAILPIEPRSVLASVVQSASAFGNSGLYVGNLPQVSAVKTHALLLPLAVIGGLGLPVLMELFDWIFRRRSPSMHARVVGIMSAGVYLAGMLVIVLLRFPDISRQTLASSSALAINSRSAGFPFEMATFLPRTVQWVVMLLMVIGASPAGTGGGLKTTTVYELTRGLRRMLTGQVPGRGFAIAVIWTAVFAAIVLGTLLLLLSSVPQMPADRVLFLAVSATGNVGLSHDPISITRDGLYTLSAGMLLGRLAPVLILWWMAETTQDADVAVG